MFSYVLDEPFLDGIYEEHRGRCYEDVLTFATLACLVRDALVTHEGSGRASFQRAKAAGELDVLEGSVYPKLARLTDLLEETRYPAEDLLEAYLSRWGIERMFQKVTDVFNLKQLLGCTPKANIFQTSFCFVIYNMIQIVRAYVARAGGVTSEQVSTEKLFDDVQEELVAWGKLGDTSVVAQVTGPVKTEKQMRNLLEHLLHDQWLERWTKAPSNPRQTRGRTQNSRGGRTSVYKVLQQHRAQRRGRHARARPSR
jgi:hypothetical protein